MIESFNKKELETKIDRYINGQLSTEEIEELWAELIQDDYHLDYLKSVANLKAVIEQKREQEQRITQIKRYWSYAAAAVLALTIGVLTIVNYSGNLNGTQVEPVQSIELDYYRSGEGTVTDTEQSQIIRNAISLANSGNFEDAVTLLENELQKAEDPGWMARLNLNLGSLYYNEGGYTRSLSYYEEVIDRQESINVLMLEKAYWYSGNAHFQLDRLKEARANIQKAYALNGAYRRVAKSYLDALSTTD